MVSLPAPPSSVSVTLSAGSVAAERVSLPAPPETMRASIDSDPLTVTTSGRPVTTRAPFWLCTSITSLPLVPLTVTLSAARSPAPAAGDRCQVDRDLRHAGAGQITHHDIVGT